MAFKPFVALSSLVPWSTDVARLRNPAVVGRATALLDSLFPGRTFEPSLALSSRVVLQRGDITSLHVDAVVNAANPRMLGGGGVDGAIHAAAGPGLLAECRALPKDADGARCRTGDAVPTGGYDLPAAHIIHTVGPVGEVRGQLESSYTRSLEVAVEVGARSVALPCISTGVYGYPQDTAAGVALVTVRDFLVAHPSDLDAVVFCVFLPSDYALYRSLMAVVFPVPGGRGEGEEGEVATPVGQTGAAQGGQGGAGEL